MWVTRSPFNLGSVSWSSCAHVYDAESRRAIVVIDIWVRGVLRTLEDDKDPLALTRYTNATAADWMQLLMQSRVAEVLSARVSPTKQVYTRAHHTAARTIQTAARRLVRRHLLHSSSSIGKSVRNSSSSILLPSLLPQHVDKIKKQAADVNWVKSGRTLRLLCLGVLPHVLVCLEVLSAELMVGKSKAVQRLELTKDSNLEAAGDAVHEIE